jgi:hypothetical protein
MVQPCDGLCARPSLRLLLNDELHTKADAPHAGHAPVRAASAADGAPLRAASFDAAQMAGHGRRLATVHALAPHEGPGRLRL